MKRKKWNFSINKTILFIILNPFFFINLFTFHNPMEEKKMLLKNTVFYNIILVTLLSSSLLLFFSQVYLVNQSFNIHIDWLIDWMMCLDMKLLWNPFCCRILSTHHHGRIYDLLLIFWCWCCWLLVSLFPSTWTSIDWYTKKKLLLSS